MEDLTPEAIVKELDKYIIGQAEAKRAVAVALRNRFRRKQLPDHVRKEITPKNILMIGPTGVGKTEIARRVARIIDAPFVKVEATKFTEVGYVGRDVESIVYELAETSISMVHERKMQEVLAKAEGLAQERILGYLCQQSALLGQRATRQAQQGGQGAQSIMMSAPLPGGPATGCEFPRDDGARARRSKHFKPPAHQRKRVAELLESKQLEDAVIEIELNPEMDAFDSVLEFSGSMSTEEMTETFNEFMQNYNTYSSRKRVRRVSVREARRLLTREEANKLIDMDQVIDEAIRRAEESGVVFIDEIDKIAGPKIEMGPDVSGEGVQRDLLPIIEGSSVMTRYGPFRTDHVLFIAAGAFHQCKPADLIPEFQGRFPLRVELKSLNTDDLERILIEPENSLTKQYRALLSTEEVDLAFTPDGVSEIARMAALMNSRAENIGARRLQTIMERVLEDISFGADRHRGEHVAVNAAYVAERMSSLVRDEDLSKYIL
ncbi:MAG: ATP-dependent protease ATPase subunit HslU [Chloroflexi bacterium]|nr:ATP-dependent protease ATPase subunit HslU [Chloroflexota bacterium]